MLRGLLKVLGVYKIYEKWLESQIKNGEIPKHIAVILDGNRRFAKSKGLDLDSAYNYGAENAEKLLEWCLDLKIPSLTLYCLSTENLKRKKEELEPIFKSIKKELKKSLEDDRIYKERVKINILGNKDLLPSDLRELAEEVEEKTRENDKFYLNLAICYGGRKEILEAVRKICEEVKEGNLKPEDLDEKTFEKFLYTSSLPHPYPDIVIRTSGEERISNFLIWQIAYSELIFVDVYWPEFRRIDLLRAIRTYQKRKRRFGV